MRFVESDSSSFFEDAMDVVGDIVEAVFDSLDFD